MGFTLNLPDNLAVNYYVESVKTDIKFSNKNS